MAVVKWGNEQTIGFTDGTVDAKEADIAGLADGGYIVVWETDTSPQEVHFQRFDAAGLKVGSESSIPRSAELSQPEVVAQSDGGFAIGLSIIISAAHYVEVDLFDSGGQGTLRVTSPGGFTSDPSKQTDVAITQFGSDASGTLVLYRDDDLNSGDIVAYKIHNANYEFFSGAANQTFLILNSDATAGVQKAPAVTSIDNGQRFVATWLDMNSGSNYDYRVFNNDGSVVTATQVVNNTPNAPNEPDVPANVVGLSNGGFVVIWDEASSALQDTQSVSVHEQMYDQDGAEVGSEFVVNSQFNGVQAYPDVAAPPNGGFVAVWSDASAGTGLLDFNIEGQEFDAFGARVGGQFIINTTTQDSEEFFPHVAALADGRLVVEWHSYSPGAGANVIRTQLIDPRDGLVTGTEGGDKLYGNDLINDEINGLGGNDTLVGLKGNDNLFGGDGNDFLKGGQGDDTLYGGTGLDTASYADKAAAVVVTLAGAHEAIVTVGGSAEDSLFEVENITGGAKSDILTGDNLANVLNGSDGDDILRGRGGNDTLNGGNGLDRLVGGAGLDKLNGGAGGDTFIYTALTESGITATIRDQITGFAAGDKIDVHLIDAIAGGGDNAFVLDTNNSFSEGEIRQSATLNGHWLIEFNADADAAADMSILLLDHATALGPGDFVL